MLTRSISDPSYSKKRVSGEQLIPSAASCGGAGNRDFKEAVVRASIAHRRAAISLWQRIHFKSMESEAMLWN